MVTDATLNKDKKRRRRRKQFEEELNILTITPAKRLRFC